MNVKVDKLSLEYGNYAALQDVSFELTDKKIYGLLGRNGAGKTSLLSILASFREQSAGSVTINGEAPFENASIMQQVAFLYNKDYKDETDSVKKLLDGVERFRPNFDREYAEYLVKRFKLDQKKAIKKLSKGMQSAVNVTIGLASRAPLTIFDEVYLGMDAPSRDIFYKELLEDQERHPRTIILSTHLVSEMDYLFDEVLLLHGGKIMLHENYDELISKGAKITGNANVVDDFVQSKQSIHEERLGGTKAVTILGELSGDERRIASDKGIEIAPVTLHELFVHLTKEDDVYETKS
ncbi:ABC transporter ATP-binding protein [Ornithinibacillus sp. BX22]|uniref:ABC transporter ATP-binding protein n=2 Tax=Ornithinibacillus TaxID=484508 RepID=A0A923L4C7_9BACI|nr:MULTISPECIES: ABC transporter ATP-binding protein [Ornithinibacillus]MBC5636239.1 ABC transporter ATP-binding protein [Ornithinibacillus hominis]MBS3681080.1 ABC transporter ATP-binding protein [Ornithinibacillus massiliensis]